MTSSPPAPAAAPAAADSPPAPPDRRAEQRRRILAAAMACFAREGFHGTSMQKICAEAGMSPGALYRYFPSKEELIAAIVADERSERQHMLDAVAQSPSILDALSDCLRLMLEEPSLPTAQLGPEIMAEAIRNTRMRAAIEPCEEETRTQLREALATAMARGEIDPALDLDDVMIMLQVMADGLILHHQLHPAWDLPRRMSALSALVRRMLAPTAAGGS
ncbi:TetR/AcrR family transcriptional regulator [Xanthobacter sp. V4C-4]|uniref:TetR/AcrR family transcriptional regulator n=1 Tax=Xanthobacter cornucopiae TaxID=3119924 RepID=UPI00372AC441